MRLTRAPSCSNRHPDFIANHAHLFAIQNPDAESFLLPVSGRPASDRTQD
jgi:hypothetical protein